MARKKRSTKKQETEIQDYRHDAATRTNNPPAGIASHGRVHEQPKQEYAYNPHLPPCLQFDENGDADQLPELLQKHNASTLRRRGTNPRRSVETPQPMARMGGQTGSRIFFRRSGCAAYPRARERESHCEDSRAGKCPTRTLC